MTNKLKTLQKEFLNSIYHKDDKIESEIKENGISASLRMNVYYNNVLGSITTALKDTYQAVNLLVGDEFFSYAVKCFLKTDLPKSGDLALFGEKFPGFLANFSPCKNIAYIEDVARMEWLRYLAYGAKDEAPLAISHLTKITPQELENLTFKFVSSANLIKSNHPLDIIFDLCFPKEKNKFADDDGIELPKRGCYLLVYRKKYHLTHLVLDKKSYVIIEKLIQGVSLGEAVDAIPENELEEFDLSKLLTSLFTEELAV